MRFIHRLFFVFLSVYCSSILAAPTGLNIVFVVDQSGSMSGYQNRAGEWVRNDPQYLRIEAVRRVVNSLAKKVEGTALSYRFSIVEFGGDMVAYYKQKRWNSHNIKDVNVVVSNCQLTYTPSRPGLAQQQAEQCLKESTFKSRWMNNTNTPEAINAVVNEFEKLNKAAINVGEIHKNKLLLITDGRPEIKGANLFKLRDKIKQKDTPLDDLAVDFWIIGINDTTAYWTTQVNGQSDGEFWENRTDTYVDAAGIVVSKAAEVEMAGEISKRIDTILESWLDDVKVSLPCGEELTEFIDIRPYYKSVTLETVFTTPGAILEISYDNRIITTLKPSRLNALKAEVTLDNPKPGSYTFNVLPENAHYCVNLHFTRPTVSVLPLEKGIAYKNEMTKVSLQVSLAEGKTLNRIAGWPLDGLDPIVTALATLTSPSGIRNEYPAKYVGKGLYEMQWTPSEEGRYLVSFQGEVNVNTDQGIQSDTFIERVTAEQSGSLLVDSARTPLWLHLEQPDVDNGLFVSVLPFFSRNVTIKLSLFKQQEAVNFNQYVTGSKDSWLTLDVVEKRSGKPLPSIKRLPFKLVEEGKYLIAEIPVELLDFQIARGDLWLYPVKIHIKLLADERRIDQQYLFAGVYLPAELAGQRIFANPMTIADITLKSPWWVLALILFIVVFLLAFIAWWLFALFIPRLIIQNEDNKRGGRVELIVYDSVNDPDADFPEKKIDLTGLSGFKEAPFVLRLSANKNVRIEYLKITRRPNAMSATAKVAYKLQDHDEKKTTVSTTPINLVDHIYIKIKQKGS